MMAKVGKYEYESRNERRKGKGIMVQRDNGRETTWRN